MSSLTFLSYTILKKINENSSTPLQVEMSLFSKLQKFHNIHCRHHLSGWTYENAYKNANIFICMNTKTTWGYYARQRNTTLNNKSEMLYKLLGRLYLLLPKIRIRINWAGTKSLYQYSASIFYRMFCIFW